jgi:hypothetical protein
MPPEAPAEASLPDEVLQIPAMQALMAGNPPALSANLQDFAKRPEASAIMGNKDALMAAGMGTYRSLSGDLGVLFNRFYVSPEEITAADKNGQLASIAIPFDVVNQQVAGSGDKNPVLEKKEAPEGFRTAPAATPPQSQSVVTSPGPSSEAELNAQRARLKNSAVGGPTSGARPAAGRLLNSILKPVL